MRVAVRYQIENSPPNGEIYEPAQRDDRWPLRWCLLAIAAASLGLWALVIYMAVAVFAF